MALDFYDRIEDTILRRLPAGKALDSRISLMGGNGRVTYLEHPQTGHRIYHDRLGRALTVKTATQIGRVLGDRLLAKVAA